MAKTTLNPDGLPVPRGSYSLVNIAQPGRMVFIAGQTASDHEGKVVGAGDARAQTRFILGKIQRAVEAAGGTMNDVVALNVRRAPDGKTRFERRADKIPEPALGYVQAAEVEARRVVGNRGRPALVNAFKR